MTSQKPPPEHISDSKTALMSVSDMGILFKKNEIQAEPFGDRTIVNYLGGLEFFQPLSEQALLILAREIEEEYFEDGDRIIKRGEQGDRMYILVDGEVRIPIKDSTTQRDMIVILGPQDIFGEMALLTGEPRFADVYAKSNCRVLSLEKTAVHRLMQEHPEVAGFLTTILGKRLLQVGMQQVGKYKLLGELGKGAMAIVYEALHPVLNRVVAVKMLSHELVYRARFQEQFRHEARLLAKLRHPHIVEVFDTEEAYATIFIIMEKITGKDLKEIVKERGTLDYDEVRKILIQTGSALHYAHKHGVIHRDIKPANIIINSEGSVKLSDFGIAIEPEGQQDNGEKKKKLQGTPNYMAPEQVLGLKLDGRCDIYALGIVAYVLLTGQTPFKGPLSKVLYAHAKKPVPSVLQSDPNIPNDLAEFVRIATEKDREKRFQSGHDIVEFLQDETDNLALEQVQTKTITFVYTEDNQEHVDTVIEKVKKSMSGKRGVIVRN